MPSMHLGETVIRGSSSMLGDGVAADNSEELRAAEVGSADDMVGRRNKLRSWR
jgi:hypothetical protein